MTERLTRADWIRHGLRTLALEGPAALKAGPLAERLQVSRGSFYWHFDDLADFRSQLLRGWQEISTDRIIEDLDAHPGEPGRLQVLMRRAFRGRRRLDRAMRAWAAQDETVAAAVAAVDERRITRVAKLLEDAGVEANRSLRRATFLYWAYLGQAAVMAPSRASLEPDDLSELIALFER